MRTPFAALLLLCWCVALPLLHAEEISGDSARLPPKILLPPTVQEVSLEEIESLLRDRPNIAILDVRTADEARAEGQLRGSKHLDILQGDFVERFRELKFAPNQPCIIYCALGGRARKAAAEITPLGYKFIFLPKGGFNAWKKAGKPVEGGLPRK